MQFELDIPAGLVTMPDREGQCLVMVLMLELRPVDPPVLNLGLVPEPEPQPVPPHTATPPPPRPKVAHPRPQTRIPMIERAQHWQRGALLPLPHKLATTDESGHGGCLRQLILIIVHVHELVRDDAMGQQGGVDQVQRVHPLRRHGEDGEGFGVGQVVVLGLCLGQWQGGELGVGVVVLLEQELGHIGGPGRVGVAIAHELQVAHLDDVKVVKQFQLGELAVALQTVPIFLFLYLGVIPAKFLQFAAHPDQLIFVIDIGQQILMLHSIGIDLVNTFVVLVLQVGNLRQLLQPQCALDALGRNVQHIVMLALQDGPIAVMELESLVLEKAEHLLFQILAHYNQYMQRKD